MEFHVLGPLTVLRDGQPLPVGGTKLRALLAVLLIHAGKPVTSDALIEELWGDQPPTTAQNTLQTYIRQLRQLLEPDRRARQEPKIVRTVSCGYQLDVRLDQIDSERFEHCVSEGRAALQAGRAQAAKAVLVEGLRLWRGRVFAELADVPAAVQEARRLDQLRLVATELRIKADLALGRHTQVIDELACLSQQNPQREDLTELLMLALYRCGRQTEALAAYRATHERLAEEVGISPCAALQELQQRILRQDPDLDLTVESATEPPPDRPSRTRYRLWLLAAVMALATGGIVAWELGWLRAGNTASGDNSSNPQVPAILNEYELAVKPGIGYDLDIPPGKPPDWHSTNNQRSPDYDFLDLYRTSPLADKDKLSGVDLRNTNAFNVIHLVDADDPPEVCKRLPEHGGGNVPLAEVRVGSQICIRTYEGRWVMLTITRLPADRAAVLFVRVKVLNKP
ncbi:BTAD domain-containing putative transcriptional regulator [Lentzea sp. NPDC005914]|uniref:AfsR/SARP family transcriptional regulator n=1 Tax=Lentzea sp. NPDC005914 TaxID=3154572 RepID=UPI0033C43B9C